MCVFSSFSVCLFQYSVHRVFGECFGCKVIKTQYNEMKLSYKNILIIKYIVNSLNLLGISMEVANTRQNKQNEDNIQTQSIFDSFWFTFKYFYLIVILTQTRLLSQLFTFQLNKKIKHTYTIIFYYR